jgi:hypothetical protein
MLSADFLFLTGLEVDCTSGIPGAFPVFSSCLAALKRFGLPVLLSVGLAALLAGSAVAAGLAELPEGKFPPEPGVAIEDGVPVRSDPGYLYREINHLREGTEVLVDERVGDWLHVRPSGWVLLEHLRSPTEQPALITLRVLTDGARVRSGPETSSEIIREHRRGDLIRAEEKVDEWWKLVDGGYIFARLTERQESVTRRRPDVDGKGLGELATADLENLIGRDSLKRWSFMDLNGVMFEITEIDPRSGFVPALQQAMQQTGVLETDWTFLRLVIGVPPGPYRFNFAPDHNTTLIRDVAGEKYGNVYVQGPLSKLPTALRAFFESQTVHPGERFEGILLFRPTLEIEKVAEVSMMIGGKLRTFYETL